MDLSELLQKHGCSNVFTVPEGLRELMSDISREVLRQQPVNVCEFIANYLSALLLTREHGILAVKILDDLCDCKPTVSEHLIQLGFKKPEAGELSTIIKEEIEGSDSPTEGRETVNELEIIKKILKRNPLDEDTVAQVCQVVRNAYREYWYRKKLLEENLKVEPDEPWQVAVQHTLEIYKKTKPSMAELTRATESIQAAYKGYYVRRSMIPKQDTNKQPNVELPGAPLDIADSRDIALGHVIDLKVHDDNVPKILELVQKRNLTGERTISIDHKVAKRMPEGKGVPTCTCHEAGVVKPLNCHCFVPPGKLGTDPCACKDIKSLPLCHCDAPPGKTGTKPCACFGDTTIEQLMCRCEEPVPVGHTVDSARIAKFKLSKETTVMMQVGIVCIPEDIEEEVASATKSVHTIATHGSEDHISDGEDHCALTMNFFAETQCAPQETEG